MGFGIGLLNEGTILGGKFLLVVNVGVKVGFELDWVGVGVR